MTPTARPLSELVEDGWAQALAPVADQVTRMGQFLREEIAEGRRYLPAGPNVLRAFTYPFTAVRVLIVGQALRRDLQQNGEDFPALLEELQTYLGPEKPGQVVKAIPGQGSNVPITLLGSSGFSAQLAGMLGLPFAFAAHFAPEYLYAATQLYREHFRPSEVLLKP